MTNSLLAYKTCLLFVPKLESLQNYILKKAFLGFVALVWSILVVVEFAIWI